MAASPPGDGTTQAPGLVVTFLAAVTVTLVAGIGGKYGASAGGVWGYWAGCYAAAILASAVAAAIYSRFFGGHPLYWIIGTIGFLAAGQLGLFAVTGQIGEKPSSGSDEFFTLLAALVGMWIGLAVAAWFLDRRSAGQPVTGQPGSQEPN